MKKMLFLVSTIFLFTACSTDGAEQARLMDNVKPPLRFNPHQNTKKISDIDEKIRLLKAQTDAKARLAEIELKKEERLKELETKKATMLAKLESEKTKTVKQLELQQAQSTNAAKTKMAETRAQADLAIEKEKQTNLLSAQKEDLAFYRQLTIAGVVLVLLLMLFVYLLYRHKQSIKFKLQEEKLKHEAYLLESKNHHERVTKLLDIIASDNTDKNIKKELTKLLKDQGEKPAILLESKQN